MIGGMGGGMGGGGFGGQLGAGGRPGTPMAGLPFAGIPPELQSGVEKVTKDEPKFELEDVPYTHRVTDTRPLTFRRLFAPHAKSLVLATLLVILETVTLQAGPYLTKVGIDKGITPKNLTVIIAAGVAYIVLVVLTAIFSGLRVAYTGRIGQRLLYELRVRIFAHQLRLSLDYFTREKAGVIMTRMTSDVEALNQLFQDGLVSLMVQGLTIVFVTFVLFSMNVELAFITVGVVVPALGALTIWYRRASDRGYMRVRDGIAFVLSDLAESLSGMRVISAYNRQLNNITHHRNVVGDYRGANFYTARTNAIYGPGSDVLGLLAQAAILAIGGKMVLDGSLTIGELTAFVLYLTAFFAPIQQLAQFYNLYQQGKAAIIKLRLLLNEHPSVPEADDAVELPPISGEIHFEDVSFGYDPEVPVLRDVDLTIAAGETFSLVGETGAGKSTIAKLVTRFYDPTAGHVLVDGHDLRDVQLASLRKQIGVVPQEPFLFAGTIRDNVAFARPHADEDEVMEAIHAVGLTELIERLPDGIDTYVHERGSSLSSGERQLLALARTFLSQPRVVVLDEATSNLDLQSETKVEAALDVLLEGRTAIIIAHRLSTAMRADRIAVVDDGRIVELGSHEQLVNKGGRYAEMYATWVSHTGAESLNGHGNGHGNGNGHHRNGDGRPGRIPH
jgi:ATP-binding cassette subfamily B protein